MYSVLIQNKKTIESFQKYHPLFLEALNNEQIGLCRWIESGTTVETALPELLDLIDDKREWKAVIVRLADESAMAQYPSTPLNPYDFRYYQQEDLPYDESPIPLVRLTHILGQIPGPEIEYVKKVEQERGKAVRTVYEPRKNETDEKRFRELLKKYDYNGPMPAEIILISVRLNVDSRKYRDTVREAWNTRDEINSSSFWKTNRYANICRFVVYNMDREGNLRREADLFRFWLTVMLLAVNEIEPDELQAYRLYSVRARLNRMKFQDTLQRRVDELLGAQMYMEQRLREEEKRWDDEHEIVPEYRMKVPVNLATPKFSDMDVEVKDFGLASNGLKEDLGYWNNTIMNNELQVRESLEKAAIVYDDSAEHMRELCTLDSRRVNDLNKYQKKHLKLELQSLFSMILEIQKRLPDEDRIIDEELRQAREDVKETLRMRAAKGQVYAALGMIIAAALLCVLPGFAWWFMEKTGDMRVLISAALIIINLISIPLFLLLLLQRQKLGEDLKKYNEQQNNAVKRIGENADVFRDFLSAIVSHSRGCSYLKILNSKRYEINNIRKEIYVHLDEITQLLNQFEKWNRAFHMKTDFSEHYYQEIEPDIYISPRTNRLYSLEYGKNYTIPLNDSGCVVDSPYDFVSKLELSREELYDYHEHA